MKTTRRGYERRRNGRRVILLLIPILIAGCSAPVLVSPELSFKGDPVAGLRVGAAAVPITPETREYLAGGIPYRPAFGVHDDLWARVVVVDDGARRVAFVALDLIGIYYDDVVRIRADIEQRTHVDYALIAATHTHNGPDVLSAWSPRVFCIDTAYRQFVGRRVAQAVADAVERLRPARLRFAVGVGGEPPLTQDTREPRLIDDTFAVWQAFDAENGATIATAVHYAAHPILIPSFNFDVSSDFPHYLRQYLEFGGEGDDGPVRAVGGVCLYFNGALGGRITPAQTAPLNVGRTGDFGYDRAQAYGYRLARRAQQLLEESAETPAAPLSIAVRTRQLRVPLVNPLLAFGTAFCFLDRALVDGAVNSEVGVVQIGPLAFFAVPGMLFPELTLGSDAAPLPGSDFPDAPLERPTLRELAGERRLIVVGLANDMVGYLIPKSQWDSREPYTTPDNTLPYGELISPGPDAARLVIEAFAGLAN